MNNLTKAQLVEAIKNHDNLYNEGKDGHNPYRVELARREAAEAIAYKSSPEARKSAFSIDDWSIEITKTRRASWNDFVRTLPKTGYMPIMAARIQEQGWNVEQLKHAIKVHNLYITKT